MLIGIGIKQSFQCEKCGKQNPVNGLSSWFTCWNCGSRNDVIEVQGKSHEGGIRYLFGDHFDIVAEIVTLRSMQEKGVEISEGEWLFEYWRCNPYCPSCGRVFPESEVRQAEEKLSCAQCSAVYSVRKKDFVTKQWDERIYAVVNDHSSQAVAPRQQSESTTRVVSCAACGASLSIASDCRAGPCEYCGNINIIPDSLFHDSKGRPKVESFFLVVEADDLAVADAVAVFLKNKELRGNHLIDENRLTALRQQFDEILPRLFLEENRSMLTRIMKGECSRYLMLAVSGRKEIGQLPWNWVLENGSDEFKRHFVARGALTEDDLAEISEKGDEALQAAMLRREDLPDRLIMSLAENGSEKIRSLLLQKDQLDPRIICRLAKDSSEKIRIAVASKNALSAEAINILVADPSPTVRRLIILTHELSFAALESLSRDPDSTVRRIAARHPLADMTILRHLNKDKDPVVAASAREHPNYVPGFFSRLFS